MGDQSRRALHDPERAIRLRLGSLELEGFSISGLSTWIRVPAFDACFDLGHCTVEASHTRNVLLSHVHQDHSLGVIRHLALREMTGAKPSRIWVPAESRDALVEAMATFHRMEGRAPAELGTLVTGVAADTTFALSNQRQVRVFDVVHRIASRGYTVVEQRRRLRQEFVGLPGAAIGEARARGEIVHDVVEVEPFTYVGDSTIATLEAHPEVARSEVLVLEATHLPGTSRETSARYGHTHLEELAELHARRPEILASPHIVLKHFSMKYGREEIVRSAEILPADLRARVSFLV
ncbi:MAG: MBL fold metallo-hydrolase [Polyangiales bacterium]